MVNSRRVATVAALQIFILILGVARADQPYLPNGQLEEKATHIVDGIVKGVYACEQGKEKGVIYYVLEVEVGSVVKGVGPDKLEVLYVRCWQRKEKSTDPSISNGQVRIPAERQSVRVYLKRAPDGGYDILEPNGIDKPPTKK